MVLTERFCQRWSAWIGRTNTCAAPDVSRSFRWSGIEFATLYLSVSLGKARPCAQGVLTAFLSPVLTEPEACL